MVSDHGGTAHLARKIARVAEQERPAPGPRDTGVGDGQGRQGESLALGVHVPLPQKKSDSQTMRRPVTFPKVPVAACRDVPSPCPVRLRYPHCTRPTAVE
jgi:hypothetical protein